MALPVVVLAAWMSDRPVSNVSRLCNAERRAVDSLDPPNPFNSRVGLPLDWIDWAATPSQNIFVPASEMMIGKLPP